MTRSWYCPVYSMASPFGIIVMYMSLLAELYLLVINRGSMNACDLFTTIVFESLAVCDSCSTLCNVHSWRRLLFSLHLSCCSFVFFSFLIGTLVFNFFRFVTFSAMVSPCDYVKWSYPCRHTQKTWMKSYN
jgi:hypothetical protein